MSAGAPINISSVLDLTGPYRELAAFRTAAAQPITIGAGPLSVPVGGATLGATGGTPYPAASVISSYPRPASQQTFGPQFAQAYAANSDGSLDYRGVNF